MQNHRNLAVWRRAHAASLEVDALSRSFPKRGYGWLATQLRRSAESVPANIVEGCGQATNREFARYLQSAISSASEAEYHLEHCVGVGVLAPEDVRGHQDELRQIQRMLVALAARVRGNKPRDDDEQTEN